MLKTRSVCVETKDIPCTTVVCRGNNTDRAEDKPRRGRRRVTTRRQHRLLVTSALCERQQHITQLRQQRVQAANV